MLRDRTLRAWAQCAAGLLCLAAGLRGQTRVVMISIDGLRPDAVLEAEQHHLQVPNLRRMAREGAFASGVHGVTPTVTYPSHTTLLTGVRPATHGIFSNTTFDPLNKNDQGWYWYAEDIRVPTLWTLTAEAGFTTVNVHWPVSVGARVSYNLPQIWRKGTEDDRKLVRALSTPGLLTALESKLGPYVDGIDESVAGDEKRARFAAALLTEKKPRFATIYFTGLDHVEHEHGPFSPEANEALEKIDALIGDMRQAAGAGAAICVVSDHGFTGTTKDVNLFVPFLANGLVKMSAKGAVQSWSATVWPAGGSAAVMLKDRNDAAAKAEVAKLLQTLASDSGNGINRIVETTEIAKLGGFPDADFLVDLKPGFQLGYEFTGPLVTARAAPGGMHGYLPSAREMRSVFFITGPGIRAGKALGEIEMVDIAPTIAGLLGLKFREIEGKAIPLR